jgi:hypothetical protein
MRDVCVCRSLSVSECFNRREKHWKRERARKEGGREEERKITWEGEGEREKEREKERDREIGCRMIK